MARFFGMRSLVESSNHRLKTAAHGDIDNVKKRSGRGYAAIYLALTFSVVASNLNRIATFFVTQAQGIQGAAKTVRSKRRRDEPGDRSLALGAKQDQSQSPKLITITFLHDADDPACKSRPFVI